MYILLVTNYANTPQSITLVEAGSNTASTDCSIVPLPVELLSFTGEKSGSTVALNWTTASEKDNDYFEVQKRNKLGFFETFAVEKGAGNTSSFIRYAAIDEAPTDKENYYQLKQVDFDGNTVISDIISVSGDWLAPALTVFPNPSQGDFRVQANQTILNVNIIGLDGVTKWRQTEVDSRQLSVAQQELIAGMYILEVETKRGKIQEKITIR